MTRVASALAAAAVALLPAAAAAAPWSAAGVVVRGDFDKDGNLERVVSSPQSDGDMGAIYIVDDAAGTTARWTRDQSGLAGDAAAAGDFFGAALAAADFDGDGFTDLAIGVPGADDGGPSDSGAIHIVYGSSSGLTTTGDQVFHQDTSGIKGAAETDDQFGDVLTAGDFDCDGYDDIVVGVPMEGISTKSDAGAVHVFYGGSSGVTTADDLWYQGSGGVNGAAEAGDHFGAALAAGNFNGDTSGSLPCEDLAIGAPDENIGSVSDAGLAYSVLGGTSGLSSTGDFAVHQNVSGVEGQSEADDRFGLRLSVLDSDEDGYDDLAVAVPGDSCLTGHGEGSQLFLGGGSGLTITGNAITCETYFCEIDVVDDVYACRSTSPPVYASSGADAIWMFVGDDVAHAGDGDDTIRADRGNDTVFGGDGNDWIDGDAGTDALMGGDGDDVFRIDLDCEVGPGGVVDGGPGTDTIESHLTRAQLIALGLDMYSIEAFVLVPESAAGDESCTDLPFEEGPFVKPRVALAWPALPTSSSVLSTTSGLVALQLDNVSTDTVDVDVVFTLRVRGEVLEVVHPTQTLTASQVATINLDLNDFIPTGVDPSTLDPALFELPTSAAIRARARLTMSGAYRGHSSAPVVYGHLENGSDAVLYRVAAYHDTYHSGDLMAWRRSAAPPSGATIILGRSEAHGSLGIPGY